MASQFLLDPRAESSFDAPKRLAALLGCAAAAALIFSRRDPGSPRWTALHPLSRAMAVLFAAAVVLAGVSALLSARRPVALDAWRGILLWALAVPLGASAALTSPRFERLTRVFVAASAASAVLSLLGAIGWVTPLRVESVSGRAGTGAFIGNEGSLSIVLAIAALAALVAGLRAPRAFERRLARVCLGVILASLVVNRNFTGAGAVAVGAAIVGTLLYGRRAVPWMAAIAMLFAAGIFLYRPARARVIEASRYARAGQWDGLVSYRGGPWVSALDMIHDLPGRGSGPGTFAAEFVRHRLSAEVRLRTRFVNPIHGSTYSEAHSEYLQAAAEAGVPAALALFSAFVLLIVALGRAVRSGPAEVRGTALGLIAVLAAGAVAALTWFPLQRAASALPLLLAAGRSWRVCETGSVGR